MIRFIILTVSLVVAVFLPAMQCGALTAPIVYVAGDGSGDFNCDGTADEVEINKALQYVKVNDQFTAVYLKGPFNYDISTTVLIGSNTTLTGDKSAVLVASGDMDVITGASDAANITISGFTVNGNNRGGSGINLSYAWRNASITDMVVENIGNANQRKYGIVINPGGTPTEVANIRIANNVFTECTFDSIELGSLNGVEIYGNNILGGTSAYPVGMRLYRVNNVKIHDNIIRMQRVGYAGIQIYNDLRGKLTMDAMEIYNNQFIDIRSAGILAFSGRTDGGAGDMSLSRQLHIHHNIFRNNGTHPTTASAGGVVLSGFDQTLIEHNVFDGCKGAAITAFQSNNYLAPLMPAPYVTYVRNNIIVNSLPHSASGNGHAVSNRLIETHTFVIENNCVYNNAGGDYLNVTASNSITADPLFADPANFDYHLKSQAGRWNGSAWVMDAAHSPCIDAGHPASDYTNEPAANGGRVNIGLYGNTPYASKSIK